MAEEVKVESTVPSTEPIPKDPKIIETNEESKDEDYFKPKENAKADEGLDDSGMKEHTKVKFDKLRSKYSSVRDENDELRKELEDIKNAEEEFQEDKDKQVIDDKYIEEKIQTITEQKNKNDSIKNFLISKGFETQADRVKKGGAIAKLADSIVDSLSVPYSEALEKAYEVSNSKNNVTMDVGSIGIKSNSGGKGIPNIDREWVTKGISKEAVAEWEKRKQS